MNAPARQVSLVLMLVHGGCEGSATLVKGVTPVVDAGTDGSATDGGAPEVAMEVMAEADAGPAEVGQEVGPDDVGPEAGQDDVATDGGDQ
jgi:hypothetical protein